MPRAAYIAPIGWQDSASKFQYLQIDASGNLIVTGGGGGGGGGTSSNFGAAFPTAGTAIGVKSGANMVALALGQATMANSVPVAFASDQSALSVSLAANQSVNQTQVNGVTVSVGNGTTDTGTQRVTLSSDSTGQVKLAAGANAIGP